jgi:rare lipoprotein A
VDPTLPNLPPAGSGRGGYYQDDGPGANPPPGLMNTPDAVVKYEPYARFANKPYSVFGQTYTPLVNNEPFTQRGVASWYGVKFHGQRTSSGEAYDMYKMTAAHPTLPIPSYARVTSLESGKSVVVRINDRGPFHSDRVIDVSYTAALKLGLLGKGSHLVQIDRLFPGDEIQLASARRAAVSEAQALPATPASASLMLENRVDMDSAAAARAQPSPTADGQASLAPGFYLQLGAYGRAGKAEEMSEKLRQSGVDLPFQVVRSGSVNRLYSGPYETRALAQQAARSLPAGLGLKPIVVRR